LADIFDTLHDDEDAMVDKLEQLLVVSDEVEDEEHSSTMWKLCSSGSCSDSDSPPSSTATASVHRSS
jgi:hypothetical protein